LLHLGLELRYGLFSATEAYLSVGLSTLTNSFHSLILLALGVSTSFMTIAMPAAHCHPGGFGALMS
jgi:hypothetical protein